PRDRRTLALRPDRDGSARPRRAGIDAAGQPDAARAGAGEGAGARGALTVGLTSGAHRGRRTPRRPAVSRNAQPMFWRRLSLVKPPPILDPRATPSSVHRFVRQTPVVPRRPTHCTDFAAWHTTLISSACSSTGTG